MLRRACLRAPPAWRMQPALPVRLPVPFFVMHVFASSASGTSGRLPSAAPVPGVAALGASPQTEAQAAPGSCGAGAGAAPQAPTAAGAAAVASLDSVAGGARRDAARENAGKIIRTLLAYVWPAASPAVRARVVASLALLVGAKAAGLAAPFLFKEVCDALDSSRGLAEAAASAGGGAAGGAVLVLPLAALLGCESNSRINACRREG